MVFAFNLKIFLCINFKNHFIWQVEKAKVIADEAVKLQKEIDKRCQHKIAEMVALMEKHKVTFCVMKTINWSHIYE